MLWWPEFYERQCACSVCYEKCTEILDNTDLMQKVPNHLTKCFRHLRILTDLVTNINCLYKALCFEVVKRQLVPNLPKQEKFSLLVFSGLCICQNRSVVHIIYRIGGSPKYVWIPQVKQTSLPYLGRLLILMLPCLFIVLSCIFVRLLPLHYCSHVLPCLQL